MIKNWLPIDSCPYGVFVWTKIHDKDGSRNVQILKRSGNLFFTKNGGMYVYYSPTHWHPSASDGASDV